MRSLPACFPHPLSRTIIHSAREERLHVYAQEKRINRIAELKGFRLQRAGHGKGHGRFYIMDLAEGGRMRSGIPDHEYSFSLDEAEAWLGEAAGIS